MSLLEHELNFLNWQLSQNLKQCFHFSHKFKLHLKWSAFYLGQKTTTVFQLSKDFRQSAILKKIFFCWFKHTTCWAAVDNYYFSPFQWKYLNFDLRCFQKGSIELKYVWSNLLKKQKYFHYFPKTLSTSKIYLLNDSQQFLRMIDAELLLHHAKIWNANKTGWGSI